MYGKSNMETYITICKIVNRNLLLTQETQTGALYQPRGSWTDEWIKKLWYIYTMEYYSAIMNEILPFEATWMDLEMTILSEVSQRKTTII